MNVAGCQGGISATGRSLVERRHLSLSVIKCNSNLLHLHCLDGRGQTKKEGRKERKKLTFFL